MNSTLLFYCLTFLPQATMLLSAMFAAPTSALLPFALLALAVLLSISFRLLINVHLTPRQGQLLTTIHAFATEGVQLLLAILCFFNSALYVYATLDFNENGEVSITRSQDIVLVALAAVGSIALHIIAIYAVDVIEGRILLGRWIHPYERQPFILTIVWLFPEMRPATQRHVLRRERQEHATRADFEPYDDETVTAMERLQYLDLALSPTQRRKWERSQHQFALARSASTSTAIPNTSSAPTNFHHQAAGLPLTPPDSGQVTTTTGPKSDTSTPTITVLSPSGVERRVSLP